MRLSSLLAPLLLATCAPFLSASAAESSPVRIHIAPEHDTARFPDVIRVGAAAPLVSSGVLLADQFVSPAEILDPSVAPPVKPSFFDALIDKVLLALKAVVLTALLAWATSQAKKNGIELSSSQQALLEQFAQQAVDFAEEQAAKLLKAGLKGPPKLDLAMKYFQQKVEGTKGLPDVSASAAHDQIHAALARSPFGAVSIDGLS